VLTVTHSVRLWMIFTIAASLGTVQAADNPSRQTFVMEMVGADRVQNAVSLNSVLTNASRTVGPAIAGGLIATVGVGVCFLVNAGSFGAVLVALSLMRTDQLHPAPPVARAARQLRAGFHYVRVNTGLLVPLLMMALIGTFAYEFPVVLPLLAHSKLHGGADVFGLLTSAMGAGAVLGGLLVATFSVTGIAPLTAAAVGFGLAILAAALVPTLATELVALVLVGAASTAFMATGNSTLQLTSDPSFRGRVMALWAVTFQGSTPIGGPIIGLSRSTPAPGSGSRSARSPACSGPRSVLQPCAALPPASAAPHPAQMDWITYQQAHNGP
jgi:MFS family permease